MPNIYLNYNEITNQTYNSGSTGINISKDENKDFELFVCYSHRPEQNLEGGDIYVFRAGGNNPGSITIKEDESYKDIPLSYAQVYFNKYDNEHNNPLILILHFTDLAHTRSRYYKLSNFDKDRIPRLKICDLPVYTTKNNIFQELLVENDRLIDIFTYNIGAIREGNVEKYNNNKINISARQEVFRKYPFNSGEFYKYIHRPFTTNISNQYKSLITYNGSLLKMKDPKDKFVDINEIQGIKYKSVSVYFGTKAKIMVDRGIDQDSVPLMVELVKAYGTNQCEYYCHYHNNKGLYWEKLDVSNYEKYTGTKLKVPMLPPNLSKNHRMLLKILKRLEFYFLETLVIMINKQKSYNNIDVLVSYDDYNKSTIINEIGDLTVTEKTREKNCLDNTGFKVFEHDLSHYDLDYDGCQLKLIIPTTNNMSKYNEITLYSSNNHHSENIENLNYQGGYVDDNVQVYFYDMDPRPLLVSFGYKAYKPKNKDKYSTEWVAIEDFDDYSEGDGVSLLKHLYGVVGFLNEVNICEHSSNYYNGRDYEIHTYDNIRIHLNVSRDDFGCYTKYEHKSNNSQGYRLGNIVYKRDNKVKGNIIYDYSSLLIQVNVYYYNKDNNHEYPLLVELEFKNNSGNSITRTKEHFKLLKGDFHMKWEIDYDATRVANEPQKFSEHLDFVKNSFNHVPELKGFSNNCGRNHLQDPTLLNRSYITTSHGTDYSAHGSSSSYAHHVRSDSNHGRSPSRGEAHTTNHQGRMSSVQQTHSHQPPPENGVEKATRIASTVGTFAIAGTGTGVAIYKYSHWIINFFKRFF